MKRLKYQDPLHVLLQYIEEVSILVILYCAYPITTDVKQRAPDCDMALVHDDDLARIAGAVC